MKHVFTTLLIMLSVSMYGQTYSRNQLANDLNGVEIQAAEKLAKGNIDRKWVIMWKQAKQRHYINRYNAAQHRAAVERLNNTEGITFEQHNKALRVIDNVFPKK